jgi:hypothetical protein
MKNIILLLCLVTTLGCKKDLADQVELLNYVEDRDNGLCQEKTINSLTVKVQYCPDSYLSLLNNLEESNFTTSQQSDRDSLLHFKLRLSILGKTDIFDYDKPDVQEYYARAQYLSYDFENDISLIINNDTVAPAIFHFSRTYGVAPYADFIVAFSKELPKEKMQLLVDEKCFGSGLLKFTFNSRDLANVPQLQ